MDQVIWKEPPSSGGCRWTNPSWVAELRRRPGRWGIVEIVKNGANRAASIRKHCPDLEVTSRRLPDGRCEIYARCVEEDKVVQHPGVAS